MALSKDQKNALITELNDLLTSSKLTVVAQYQGMTVKSMQALRKEAKDSGTAIKVFKNRLVIKAISGVESIKDVDTTELKSQLVYAFNSADEVAPAKTIADFAKKEPALQFVGAITAEGLFISADEVKALASLPSKNQLIAGIINTLNSPVMGVMSGLQGNLHGLLQGLEAKATK
jgi:large subunit ribosomal protein L10